MAYRDEKETLRVRVAELEGELSDAQQTIDRLTGLSQAPDTGATEVPSKILAAPKLVRFERELDFEVSDAGLEAIATALRQRIGAGAPRASWNVAQVGRSLTAPGFSLTQRDGMTQISMTGDYTSAGFGAVSGAVLLGGFGAFATFAIIHDFISAIGEAQVLWMAPLMMVLVFAMLRTRIGRSTRENAEELRGVFETVVELAKRNRVREPARARVEVGDDEEEEPALQVEPPRTRESEAG